MSLTTIFLNQKYYNHELSEKSPEFWLKSHKTLTQVLGISSNTPPNIKMQKVSLSSDFFTNPHEWSYLKKEIQCFSSLKKIMEKLKEAFW